MQVITQGRCRRGFDSSHNYQSTSLDDTINLPQNFSTYVLVVIIVSQQKSYRLFFSVAVFSVRFDAGVARMLALKIEQRPGAQVVSSKLLPLSEERSASPWKNAWGCVIVPRLTEAAAKCARAHFTSKWSRPSHRPPQGRPTLLLRVYTIYALGGEWREPAAEDIFWPSEYHPFFSTSAIFEAKGNVSIFC